MQDDQETNGHAVGTAQIQRGADACDATDAYAEELRATWTSRVRSALGGTIEGGRECLSGLPLPTREQVTKAWGLLVCALLWLPGKLLHVFLGTYMSRNEDVRKAGLVADVNGVALIAAIILLITSRAASKKGWKTLLLRAWANLLQSDAGVACASLDLGSFSGFHFQGMHFNCLNANGRTRWGRPVNASDMGQLLAVLQVLGDECKTFDMGVSISTRDMSICYALADSRSFSVSRIINLTELQTSYEFDQGVNSWISLDLIMPEQALSAGRCAEGFDAAQLASASANPNCYSRLGVPNGIGVPQGMETLRCLDRSGGAIFLMVKCGSSLREPSEELQRCINSSAQLGHAMGAWSQDFTHDPMPANPSGFQLKGSGQGAFCPANGTLQLSLFSPSPYRCQNGVQDSNVSLLNDEIQALKGNAYFPYFQCLSYDELFGVYVGVIGVLMSVAVATITLYVTDVVRPMLLARREDWSWSAVQEDAGVNHLQGNEGSYVREKKVMDVFLRCIAGCIVGTVLGVTLIYAPWRTLLEHEGCSSRP